MDAKTVKNGIYKNFWRWRRDGPESNISPTFVWGYNKGYRVLCHTLTVLPNRVNQNDFDHLTLMWKGRAYGYCGICRSIVVSLQVQHIIHRIPSNHV